MMYLTAYGDIIRVLSFESYRQALAIMFVVSFLNQQPNLPAMSL